ncbi:MAG: NGG1p interacting factor NIF3 [Candidatus Omnitrophica bacterium]|nr:NGG1p interacting factor NIF3 [Candidatus Omnitrophota bacterium]MCM8793958.1 NGG1p interacting factor NIF3 [Candidatus Omnitrophota bacterium]
MKLKTLYEFVVKYGMEVDPRGKETVLKTLERAKKEYSALKEEEKKRFDLEKLTNPYADTRILNGDHQKEIKTILAGIDMEVGEVLLADRLREKGKNIDLIMAHHPEGYALAGFYEVMRMQADILNKMGVSITVAEDLLGERIKEVERKVLPLNHTRAVDVAKLLDFAFICVHTPSDNCVTGFLQKLIDKKKPESLGDIVEILREIPEYQWAEKNNAGPKILIGDKNKRAGKVFVEMTGGTEGSKEIFNRLAQAGVGTLVCMHLSEEHFQKVKTEHINVIIAGHIASDSLGLNLLLDALEKKEKFEVITCSGFQRIRHK